MTQWGIQALPHPIVELDWGHGACRHGPSSESYLIFFVSKFKLHFQKINNIEKIMLEFRK